MGLYDISAYRIRAYLRNSRTRAAREKLRSKSSVLHLKRVAAEIRLFVQGSSQLSQVLMGRLILNDLQATSIRICTAEPLYMGQEVEIVVREPRPIYVRGIVVFSHNFQQGSRVISPTSFKFRVGIRPVFETPQDEKEYSQYCLELMREHLHTESRR
jgi:hypothetical protein